MPDDLLLAPLESLLNRNLAVSARARELAARLAGRSLELRATPVPLRLCFTVAAGRVTVRRGGTGEADAVIEGTPLALAGLAGRKAEDSIRAGTVRISGDAEVAQCFRRLFEATRPDFEEELSRVVGDVAAHHLASAARGALAFGRRTLATFADNLGEYLTEESRDLPARPETEAWYGDVDRLREDTDRLEARVRQLEQARGARR